MRSYFWEQNPKFLGASSVSLQCSISAHFFSFCFLFSISINDNHYMVQSGTRLYLLCMLQHPFTSSKAPKESKPEITKSMIRSFNICVSFVSISDRVQPENKDLNVCFFRAQCWFISTANCISHHLGFEQVFIACNIFLLLFGG